MNPSQIGPQANNARLFSFPAEHRRALGLKLDPAQIDPNQQQKARGEFQQEISIHSVLQVKRAYIACPR